MSLKAPTPPTPPTIDKGDVQSSTPHIDAREFFDVPEMPFHEGRVKREEGINPSNETPKIEEKPAPVEEKEVDNESLARDAVANGSGALTKRTVTKIDNDAPQQNSTQIVTPPEPVPNVTSDRYERGQAVLKEFREADNQITEKPLPISTHNTQAEGHGGIFWIATIIFVIVATFIVAKKFLFRSKPALKKSDLFSGSSEKLKSMSKSNSTQTKPAEPPKPEEKKPPVKPVRLPKNDDDDKGKRFEVRI